jgi:hypothetical protein
MLERREAMGQDARLVEHLQRAIGSGDMQLVPRRAFERALAIRPDLGGDAETAEQAERAARDGRARHVEMHRDFAATAEVDAAGCVKQAGQLRELVAVASGRDRGKLAAKVVRE